MRTTPPRRQPRHARGQAIVETILVTFGLMMILAIMVQVFLIDQHAYRLATKAHSRLFSQEAYPNNRPDTEYLTKYPQKFEGPDEYVPIIGYFRMFGLTRDDMRIRTTHGRPGGYKRIKLGRGTKPDAEAGAQEYVDVGMLKRAIAFGIEQTVVAKMLAQLAM